MLKAENPLPTPAWAIRASKASGRAVS